MAFSKSIVKQNEELQKKGERIIRYGLKLRLEPTEDQKQTFQQAFGCARFAYNFYLQEKQEVYQLTNETLSYTTFKKSFNALKTHPKLTWLKNVDKFVCENAFIQVDDAYRRFFDGKARFPRYKRKRASRQSYTTNFTNNNIRFDPKNQILRLPKVGDLAVSLKKRQKERLHSFEGRITAVTVSHHRSGAYYAALKIEKVVPLVPPKDWSTVPERDVLALDLGLTHFAITSYGQKIDNPRFYQEKQQKLARMQRKLKNKTIGSANYEKQVKKISKFHLHLANTRKNYLHQLSRKLVDENQVIVLEDLNVKGMIRNKRLAKSIQDVGWGMFRTFISYKCDWANKKYVAINRFYPSSKLCGGCEEVNVLLTLSERVWVCPACGALHDRDENAAHNIKKEGLRLLGI